MIRRIVASLVPLLVAAPLMAQTMVGVRAGLSRATVSPEVEGEGIQDGRQGVVAGLDIAFPLASTVELRIGGAYSQKGASYSAELASEGFDDIGGSGSIEADYVQLSALARIGTPRDGGASVGLLLGPWAASLLSCDASLSLNLGELGSVNESGSCDDPPKSTDFGIAAGAGVEMAISDGLWLGVDVIYSVGLTNVDETAAEDVKTRHLAIQAGLVIPFGG